MEIRKPKTVVSQSPFCTKMQWCDKTRNGEVVVGHLKNELQRILFLDSFLNGERRDARTRRSIVRVVSHLTHRGQ